MLILHTLEGGEHHGYAISRAIRIGTNEVLRVETGSLYPALHRLERRRLVQSRWRTSEKGQRAKYYRLTAGGKTHLADERLRWEELVRAVHALGKTRGQEG